MRERRTPARAALALGLSAVLWACFPGTGQVKLEGDGLGVVEGGLADASPGRDGKGPSADRGPRPDGVKLPDGQPPKADSKPPLKPDTGLTAPAPPFGQSVGMTASNFQNIPDCNGTLYSLHSYFNKKKGVIIAMMSPS